MKVLFGKDMAALNSALSAHGLTLEGELSSGFAGLASLVASGSDGSELSAKVDELQAALSATVEQSQMAVKALESTVEGLKAENEKLCADVLKADRMALNIDNMAPEKVDHMATWKAMPNVTAQDRKARAEYFENHIKNKIT